MKMTSCINLSFYLGYYIYTETSYPRQPGDRARLASQPLSGTMNYQYCTLRLYYHMYGDHIGKLSVKIRECKKCKERLIWSRDTSAGNYWVRHFVNIQNDKPFQVKFVFEAHSSIYI